MGTYLESTRLPWQRVAFRRLSSLARPCAGIMVGGQSMRKPILVPKLQGLHLLWWHGDEQRLP